DVLYLRQIAYAVAKDAEEFFTLVCDLRVSEGDLLNGLNKTRRYEIRRAEREEDLTFTFYEPGVLFSNRAAVAEFSAFYQTFAKQKGLPLLKKSYLDAAVDANMLYLSCARKNDSALVWHCYIGDNFRARLLLSASHFRSQASDQRRLIGQA